MTMGFPFCICNITLLLFVLGLLTAVITAAPYPVVSSLPKLDNLSVSDKIKTLAFKVPCFQCLSSGHDAVLEFEIQHPLISSTTDLCTVPLALNGQAVTPDHGHSAFYDSLQISASDWTVDLAVQDFCDTTGPDLDLPRRAFFFEINKVDNNPIENSFAFTVVLDQSDQAQVLIASNTDNQSNCASALSSVVDDTSSIFTLLETTPDNGLLSDTDIDLQERHLRRRLYDQATALHKLNEECRKSTQDRLADCHHDISCLAKVMCERIHDTTMARIRKIQASLHDSVMVSKQRYDQYVVAGEKDDWDFNVTDVHSVIAAAKEQKSKDEKDTRNPIILALEIFAAVCGLGTLVKVIFRRFCSLRRRVEHLADREERVRARHFRNLARKEALRKKWASFKKMFKRNPRTGDYEEKRALILEAAEQAQYMAEEGIVEVGEMDDALGDLQRAHDMVTAMVISQHRDPQYRQSFETRSRASSSLPSYFEEKLPDYTSNPDSDVINIADEFRYAPSMAGSGSGSFATTAITPDSSIVVTPRCSRETLRTGTEISRDDTDL